MGTLFLLYRDVVNFFSESKFAIYPPSTFHLMNYLLMSMDITRRKCNGYLLWNQFRIIVFTRKKCLCVKRLPTTKLIDFTLKRKGGLWAVKQRVFDFFSNYFRYGNTRRSRDDPIEKNTSIKTTIRKNLFLFSLKWDNLYLKSP